MHDLDLKSLRLLVAVCEHRNIKLAAAQAHIEPSAISKRIAALEATLGTPLLLRGRRGVQPTPAGEAVLEHARRMIYMAERLESDMAAFAGGLRGQVRMVASASAIAESLLDDVAAFMREPAHQGIRVSIEEQLSTEVVRQVRDGSAAVGVAWDSVDMSGLACQPYRRDALVLAVHPSHPLARRRTLRFEQTLAHDHVGLPPATAVYTLLHRAAARAGQALVYRIVVSGFDAALRVVQANLGVSVIPAQVAAPRVASGEIATVALSDDWAQRRFAVCSRASAALTPAAARMIEFLARQAAQADP